MTLDNDCCRMERYKYALYTRFKEPRLYRLAAKGDWAPIPQRCRTHPKEAEFIHRYAPSDTALHQILRFPTLELDVDCKTRECLEKVKEEAIASLIDTYRPIASITDSFGRMPLHLACMDIANCGETSFYRILEAWPKAAAHQDMEGRSPLHYLVARNDEIPQTVVERLVTACPEALKMTDLVKETPLNLVEARRSEIQNAGVILKLLNVGDVPTLSTDTDVIPIT